ncbi:MAG: hypothetical protein WC061_06255 [Melioribacteraceae bacterium]
MNDKQIVIGIFENELYASIAKRDLRIAGIKANILKEGGGVTLRLLRQAEGVKIIVPEPQEMMAREILQTRFL